MSNRIRLSKEERREQICNAARSLFIQKGFENTTMKDITEASGISIGGLYHHYKNIYDVLSDVIMTAESKKNDIFLTLKTKNPNMSPEELIIEVTVNMIFDNSEYSVLYVQLLIGMKENDNLGVLYSERKEKAKEEFLNFLKKQNMEKCSCLANDDFIDFFHSSKIGHYYLNGGDSEYQKRDRNRENMYRDFIKNYLEMKQNSD